VPSRTFSIAAPHVRRRTGSGSAGVQLGLVGADILHECLEVIRRKVALDDQHLRKIAEQSEMFVIGDRVVAQVLVKPDTRHVRAGLADLDRIAVGRRARGPGRADRSAGPGDVFDHQRLSEITRKEFGIDARDGVGRSAGGERHDHGDRLVRVVCLSTKNGWHAKCACQAERDGAAVQNSGRHEEILPSVDRFMLIVLLIV